MDANKTAREETRWQLHKNAACNPQQVLCTATCPLSRKSIQVRRTRHAGHCWRSRDETHKRCTLMDPHTWPRKSRTDQHERTFSSYVRNTGCCPEDLPRAMNDREEWRERVKISVLPRRYDDDDDIYMCVCVCVCMCVCVVCVCVCVCALNVCVIFNQ